jgi:CBS-domain-containing membrane protein
MTVHELTAAEIMSTKIVPVSKDMELVEAFKMFHKHQVSAFPVVDHEAKYVGVISQTDLIPMLKPINDLQDLAIVGIGGMSGTLNTKAAHLALSSFYLQW